jgi:DNA-directed RNA polymerase subunit RPC12/RpoP
VPSGARTGARRAILSDLSPAACHIAYNYTHPVDVKALKAEFDRIMQELQPERDWLCGTICDRCGAKAAIQYTVWSDVYKCCRCGERMALWDVAVDHNSGRVKDIFSCPACGFMGKKTRHTRVESVPVVTNYECYGACSPVRSEHRTTEAELRLIEEIKAQEIPYWYPTDPFGPRREMWRGGHRDAGITRVCDFYTKRNLRALAALWDKVGRIPNRIGAVLRFIHTALNPIASIRTVYGGGVVVIAQRT